jgi:hypothetical protein
MPTRSRLAVERLSVSTRNYDRSLEPTPAGMTSRGASKSAVSRRFVGATTQTLTEMMGHDLSGLAICALIIDGIHVGDHLVVVALGIDEQGEKHVLGLHEGATENESTCRALIADLVARGVRSAAPAMLAPTCSPARRMVELASYSPFKWVPRETRWTRCSKSPETFWNGSTPRASSHHRYWNRSTRASMP